MQVSALVTAQGQYLTRGSTVILITPSMRSQVVVAVDFLHRRGLRPVVILLDAGTFGGPKGADKIEESLRALVIPVRRIANGDDLENVLNYVGH